LREVGLVSETRFVIPALANVYSKLDVLAYTLVRVSVGGFMLPHGLTRVANGGIQGTAQFMAKLGLEPAYALAMYVTVLEIVGGILLVIGLLTRPAALLVVGFMAVAAAVHLQTFGYFWTKTGGEVPLFWGAMALVVLIKGGGEYSVDRILGREF
jgi:putative oxidoreductase